MLLIPRHTRPSIWHSKLRMVDYFVIKQKRLPRKPPPRERRFQETNTFNGLTWICDTSHVLKWNIYKVNIFMLILMYKSK